MPVFIVQSTQFWNQLRSPGLYLLSMIFDVFLEMRAPCLTTALKMRFDKLNSIMVSDVLLQLCRLKSIMAGTSYLLNEYAAVQQEFLFCISPLNWDRWIRHMNILFLAENFCVTTIWNLQYPISQLYVFRWYLYSTSLQPGIGCHVWLQYQGPLRIFYRWNIP